MKSADSPAAREEKMLRLLLVDSELELIPGEICRHPAVSSSAKRKGKKAHEVLLDSTLHHSTLKDLPNGNPRQAGHSPPLPPAGSGVGFEQEEDARGICPH